MEKQTIDKKIPKGTGRNKKGSTKSRSKEKFREVSPDFDPESILEEMFETGYATKRVEVIPGKAWAVIRSISASDQLNIEKEMENMKGGTAYILHMYSIKLLCETLLKYKDKEFKDRSAVKQFLESKNTPSLIINKLVREQNTFDREVAVALKIDNIESTFFDRGRQLKEPELSQKEYNSEKKTASGK